MVDAIFTRTTLIHYVKTQLNPNRARLHRNGQRARHCSTGIITNIKLDDGTVVNLDRRSDGRVGAVYVRVSKPKQADYKNQGDSFSPDFQIWNCAMYFITRGEAFVVFTDAGLSGADPIDNPEICEVCGRHGRKIMVLFLPEFYFGITLPIIPHRSLPV